MGEKDKKVLTCAQLLANTPVVSGGKDGNPVRRTNHLVELSNMPPYGGYKSGESQDTPKTDSK